MATIQRISVVRLTRPEVIRIKKASRDETQEQTPVDITGYTIKFIIKKRLSDEDALAFFDLAASIEDAGAGVYKLSFTTLHTCLPHGLYKGELRFWSGSSSLAPDDAELVDFEITEAVERYQA